jgi:hypothetical protein
MTITPSWPGVIAAFRDEYPRHPTPTHIASVDDIPVGVDGSPRCERDAISAARRDAVIAAVKKLGVPIHRGGSGNRYIGYSWDDVARLAGEQTGRTASQLYYAAKRKGEV